jgi:L-lactate utilization protein LutB
MPEPTDMIMPMLHEIREETRQGFSCFDGVEARLRAVEKLVKAQREAFEGESGLCDGLQ